MTRRRQAYKPSCPASPGLAGNIQACPGNKQGLPRPSIAHSSPSNFCLRNGKAQAHASAARCYQLIMQFFELTSTFFFFFFLIIHCCDFSTSHILGDVHSGFEYVDISFHKYQKNLQRKNHFFPGCWCYYTVFDRRSLSAWLKIRILFLT